MALVLPLLVTLLVGACDFGRFAHTQLAVVNAARAGAGQACRSLPTVGTRSRWDAAVRRVVQQELEGLTGFDSNSLTVTTDVIAETSGAVRASVQVSYPFRTLISWGGVPNLLTFRETCTMRILNL